MYKRIASVLVLAVAVSCNDLTQGPEGGRNIFNETRAASPAIWKQKDAFTVKANDTEVIRRVVITDRRPDKDGEAKITEGGQGQKNVTIELKSPTILRGYDFHVEVYAVDETQGSATGEPLYPEEVGVNTDMENDTKVNLNSKTEGSKASSDEVLFLNVTDEAAKKVDPLVQYLSQNKTEFVQGTQTTMPLQTQNQVAQKPHEELYRILHPKLFSKDSDEVAATTAKGVSTSEGGVSTTKYGVSTTEDGVSTTEDGVSTTEDGLSTTEVGVSVTKNGVLDSIATKAGKYYKQEDV